MNATYFLAVAAGGASGAMLRYLTLMIMSEFTALPSYIATFFINVTGSFLAGCLVAFISSSMFFPESVRLFLLVGILGSFTTFSTFSLDSYMLFERQEFTQLAVYMGCSVILSICFFALGYFVFKIGG
ncbi:CrcB family protein [Alphaproteobacteria bacterium]|nr:CrcB family protein [Alphaproteobacteria bacterium]